MIPKYVNYWLTIIDTMSNQNTYKLAWGRAILEYLDSIAVNDEDIIIDINELSRIVLKYYWNQLFFFHLKQAPNDKAARIIEIVQELIELYKNKTATTLPKWFNEGYSVIQSTNEYKKAIHSITKLLEENPGTYFPNANMNGKTNKTALPIYIMNKKEDTLLFKSEDVKALSDYNVILAKLLTFKWAQLLESYNLVPRVNEKITAINCNKIDRNGALTKYKNALINASYDKQAHDFYNNNEIIIDEISVDHVIPWSFIYSDDIWNLVLTTKSTNSSKSNSIPSEDDIKRLKIRNVLLVDTIQDAKYKAELIYSIENNLIDRFYYECKVAK